MSSVTPMFGFASEENKLTLIGSAFSKIDFPMCILHKRMSKKIVQVDAIVVNGTVMTCEVETNALPSSDYAVSATNNGGADWGQSVSSFQSILLPSINSLYPKSGMENQASPLLLQEQILLSKGCFVLLLNRPRRLASWHEFGNKHK